MVVETHFKDLSQHIRARIGKCQGVTDHRNEVKDVLTAWKGVERRGYGDTVLRCVSQDTHQRWGGGGVVFGCSATLSNPQGRLRAGGCMAVGAGLTAGTKAGECVAAGLAAG